MKLAIKTFLLFYGVAGLLINNEEFEIPCNDFAHNVSDFAFYTKVVVIPDVHGDIVNLKESLSLGGIDWSAEEFPFEGSKTLLVFLGDLINGEKDSLACFELVESLVRASYRADVSSLKVVRLLGDHEVSCIQENCHFQVAREDFAKFGGVDERTKAFHVVNGALGRTISREYKLVETFFKRTPGRLPDVSHASTIFVHAGLYPPNIGHTKNFGKNLTEVNRVARKFLMESDWNKFQLRNGPLLNWENSPILSTLFGDDNLREDLVCEKLVEPSLRLFGAARMVVGHMAKLKMKSKCGGRLFLTDVGMSRHISGGEGNPAAFVMKVSRHGLRVDKISAIYRNHKEEVLFVPDEEEDDILDFIFEEL